jgi:hypothetical protein
MSKNFPSNFSSFEEYNTYLTCLKKCDVGDMVEVYFYGNNNFHPSNIKTDITKIVPVIGKRIKNALYEKDILVGYNENNIDFWVIDPTTEREYVKLSGYKYGFWLYPNDILVKRIIKNRK